MRRNEDLVRAHRHSIRHRAEIEDSRLCGCFYCLAIYDPKEIGRWVREAEDCGETALCPRCSIDSVIGDASGFTITPEFLRRMNGYWCKAR